ncbi:unnamed protein product, partial [Ectocarpus sp. 13 AM-2016]
VPVLFGKGRKKRGAAVSQDSSSWYDEDEEDVVVGGASAGDSDEADAAAAAAFSTTPAAAATAEAGESSGNSQEVRRDVENRGDKGSSSATLTDDALLPPLDDDGNQIVLEPVWVEGETQGEKPIVEAYGLNDALAGAEDGIDIDNGMIVGGVSDDETLLIPAADAGVLPGGLGDGVGPESWRNGMEVPDDDVVLGERFNTVGRGLDDMLMERSIRFYDPKVTGERERCYLVGLEASGWGMGNKRNTKGSFPEKGAAAGDGDGEGGEDDGWTEEQEAAFQEEKQLAYEARKEEREMRFTLEESMAELSELAGTAGLEVAGSTYQRVLEPNPRTYIGTGKVQQ